MKEILKPKIQDMETILESLSASVQSALMQDEDQLPVIIKQENSGLLEERAELKKKTEEQMNLIMLEIRKKVSASPLTEQDIKDREEGIQTLSTADIVRTEISDKPGDDPIIKTEEDKYRTWIKDAYNQHKRDVQFSEDFYGQIAVLIANKCRADWHNFLVPQRAVYVAILRKPGCTKDDLDSREGWTAMEFSLAKVDLLVVIKYTYHQTDQQKDTSERFMDSMLQYNPITLTKNS